MITKKIYKKDIITTTTNIVLRSILSWLNDFMCVVCVRFHVCAYVWYECENAYLLLVGVSSFPRPVPLFSHLCWCVYHFTYAFFIPNITYFFRLCGCVTCAGLPLVLFLYNFKEYNTIYNLNKFLTVLLLTVRLYLDDVINTLTVR